MMHNLFAFQGSLNPSASYVIPVNEPSGAVYNETNHTLYTHSDGQNSTIYQMTIHGVVLDSFIVYGNDFEGITINAGQDTLYLVEEATSRIEKYILTGNFTGAFQVNVNPGLDNNNGLEGITIDPATGHIFVVKEKDPVLLVELSQAGNELSRDTLDFLSSYDASGITVHPQWNNLFILSHEGHAIYETTKNGKLLRSWSIPVEKAEGITFNTTLDTIYIVDDLNNTLYVFPFHEKPFIHSIYINEFMAGNSSTITDENGEYDDWIELYNPNDYPVDIAGLSIADNFTRSGLWEIPKGYPAQTTISAEGYLLLWADEDTSQGPLHVNIKLNVGGEQIALYNKTTLLDSISFPPQKEDISYGRETDGADKWDFFSPPSPDENNMMGVILNTNGDINASITSFILHQNYPNPFNPSTMINYQLAINSKVTLRIYDIDGKIVATLVDQYQNLGYYTIKFNASRLHSGIYFCRLKTSSGFSQTHRMILIK